MNHAAKQMHPKCAFSLVELSIVLVILGLLVGGVLSGQALIRAAELRAVSTEYSRYVTAVQSFRDKYFALPGDMTNAESFWGTMSTGACPNATAGTGTQTCNGTGDGQVLWGSAVSTSAEAFQFWRQLANAGLLEGSYSGLADSGTSWPGAGHDFGVNVPASKLSNAGWSATKQAGYYAGDGALYAGTFEGKFILGAEFFGNFPLNSVLKPEELWNIDTKLDDGKPGTGKVIARDNGVFGSVSNTCTTSTSATDFAGVYSLSNPNIRCAAYFVRAF